jgi:hypothetical protein
MRSKMRRMDILRIVVSFSGSITFGKFLLSTFDTIEDTTDGRICQVKSQLNLNQFSTNSQPTKRLFCGII